MRIGWKLWKLEENYKSDKAPVFHLAKIRIAGNISAIQLRNEQGCVEWSFECHNKCWGPS